MNMDGYRKLEKILCELSENLDEQTANIRECHDSIASGSGDADSAARRRGVIDYYRSNSEQIEGIQRQFLIIASKLKRVVKTARESV